MTKLLVRAPLAHLDEAESAEDRDHLTRLQNRRLGHVYGTTICCVPTNSASSRGSSSSRRS